MKTIQEHRRPGNRSTAETAIDRYVTVFSRLLDDLDRAAVLEVVDVLRGVRAAGRTVYIAGNGGSAAIATHFANDLGKATRAFGRFRACA